MSRFKKYRYVFMLSLIALLTVIVAGCNSQNTNSQKSEVKNWPKGVTWSGSALGGAHYMYGSVLSQIITAKMNVQMTVEATGGPWQNLDLVNQHKSDFVPSPGASAYEAYHGLGNAKGVKHENIRTVLPIFPQYLYWWALPGKGIQNYKDLNGRVVSMAGAASFLNDYGIKLFDMFGIKPKKIVNIANFDDTNEMLKDGQLDAVGIWSGVPTGATQQIASTSGADIFGVPVDDAKKFAEKYPVSLGTIPPGTYTGQNQAIDTLSDWTLVFTNKDLPDDFIYNFVKVVFENHQDIVNGFKAAKDCVAENIKYSRVPLHPGAIKYYEEIGIKLPPEAYPPEYKK